MQDYTSECGQNERDRWYSTRVSQDAFRVSGSLLNGPSSCSRWFSLARQERRTAQGLLPFYSPVICFVCQWYVRHFKLTDRWIYPSSSRQVFCSFPNLRGVNGPFFCWRVSRTAGVHNTVEALASSSSSSSAWLFRTFLRVFTFHSCTILSRQTIYFHVLK